MYYCWCFVVNIIITENLMKTEMPLKINYRDDNNLSIIIIINNKNNN